MEGQLFLEAVNIRFCMPLCIASCKVVITTVNHMTDINFIMGAYRNRWPTIKKKTYTIIHTSMYMQAQAHTHEVTLINKPQTAL